MILVVSLEYVCYKHPMVTSLISSRHVSEPPELISSINFYSTFHKKYMKFKLDVGHIITMKYTYTKIHGD